MTFYIVMILLFHHLILARMYSARTHTDSQRGTDSQRERKEREREREGGREGQRRGEDGKRDTDQVKEMAHKQQSRCLLF